MKNNIGEAILIIGAIYLITIMEGWTRYLLFFFVGVALATWSYTSSSKERDKDQEELLKVTIHKMKLEIQLMAAQTQFYVAQGAAIMKGLKRQ